MPVILGDNVEVMKRMDDCCIDSIVTDPPAGINFMKAWDSDKGGRDCWIEWMTTVAIECLRVSKPGGHALVWSIPRTSHWTATAWENAGWECRDKIVHIFGSGFPKSLNIEKKIMGEDTYLNIIKAIDNKKVLLQWKDLLNVAKSVDQKFQKNTIEIGTNIIKKDSVPENVFQSSLLKKENLSAIIAELNFLEAHLISEEKEIIVPENVGMNITLSQNHAKFVEKLLQNQNQYLIVITSIVQCVAKELQKEKMVGNLAGEEVLKIWLGKKKCLNNRDINVLCVGLTKGLKRIILNQSRIFQSLDTMSQTEYVCATSITITESIMDSLILYMVNILKEQTENKFVKKLEGHGTALKPAHEDWLLFRKPLIGTVAQNVLKYGVGGINIDGCRVETNEILHMRGDKKHLQKWKEQDGRIIVDKDEITNSPYDHNKGRFPANLILDDSAEVLELFPHSKSGAMTKPYVYTNTGHSLGKPAGSTKTLCESSEGSAARFFYCAKASRSERGIDNKHCTVKPLALMRYLCRLITPPGGLILDPFAGSGSTGVAAKQEGFQSILIELEQESYETANARMRGTR